MNGMNYIIDPSWFYWIRIVDGFRTLTLVLGCIGIVICAVGLPFYYIDEVYDDDDKKQFKRVATKIIAATAILWLLTIFIPSRSTLIEMQIAKYATYENAHWTIENIKSAVDYIIEAVKSVK